MPKIHSFRIINIDYADKSKKINDLYIEMEGKNSNLILANGSGKTFIITLLFQTILPGLVDAEGRSFDSIFNNIEGTSHIVIKHILDNHEYLLTGIVLKKTDKIHYYNYLINSKENLDLRDIDYIKNGYVNDFEDFKKNIADDFNSQIFSESLKYNYYKKIQEFRIFKNEWMMMSKANKIEGGISDIMGDLEKKKTSDLIAKFIIPNITNMFKTEKDNKIIESIKAKYENIKELPETEQKIKNSQNILKELDDQLSNVKKLEESEDNKDMLLYELFMLKDFNEKYLKNFLEDKKRYILEKEDLILQKDSAFDNLKKLDNAYNLFILKNLLENKKKKDSYNVLLNNKINDYKNNIKLINGIKIYNELLNNEKKLDLIEKEIENIEKDFDTKEKIKEISSVLYDYYFKNIYNSEEKIKTLESEKNSFKNQIEICVRKNAEIKNEIKDNEKSLKKLNVLLEDFKTLENKEKYDVLLKNKILISEKIIELENKIEDNKIQLQEQKILTNNLNYEIDNIKEKLIEKKEFQNNLEIERNEILNYMKFYKIKDLEILKLFLNKKLSEYIVEKSIYEKRIELNKNIINFIYENEYLPEPNIIKKLSMYLEKNNFFNYSTGYKLLRENPNLNPLFYYSLIIEKNDMEEFNKKIKKFDIQDDIIFVFDREKNDYDNKVNYIQNENLFVIKNEFLKLVSGDISKQDFIIKLDNELKNDSFELEKIDEELKSTEQHSDKIINFVNKYGKNVDEYYLNLKNDIELLENNLNKNYTFLNESIELQDDLKIDIDSLNNKIIDFKKEILVIENNIKDFEKIFSEMIYLGTNINDYKTFIKDLECKSNNLILEDKRVLNEKNHIDFEIKKIEDDIILFTSEIANFKNNLNKYIKGDFYYENQNISKLEEEYKILIRKYDKNDLLERRSEIKENIQENNKDLDDLKLNRDTVEKSLNIDFKRKSYYEEQIEILYKEEKSILGEIGAIDLQIKQTKKLIDNFNVEPIDENIYEKSKEKINLLLKDIEKRISEKTKLIDDNEKNIFKYSENIKMETHILSIYSKPDKKHINLENLKNMIQLDIHGSFLNKNNNLKILENHITELINTIEKNWLNLKMNIKEKAFDLTLNFSKLFDEQNNFTKNYNYKSLKGSIDNIKNVIENQLQTLIEYKNNSEKYLEVLINNILMESKAYFKAFKDINNFSKIKIGESLKKTVDIKFNEQEEEKIKGILLEYIKDFILKIKNEEKEDAFKNIEKFFSVNELLKVINGGHLKLKVYKPSSSKDLYKMYDWENVNSWSGGEKFFSFFCVYISLALKIRNISASSMTIILDNPFGKASSEHILEPLIDLLDRNNIQLITFTALSEQNLTKYFKYNYSLVLVKSFEKENLVIMNKEENKFYFEKGFYHEKE